MEGNGVSCKKQFRLQNFGFGYQKPYQFSMSEWRWPHGVFVAWRVFWCVWHLGWLVRSIQDQVSGASGEKWPIYLTNWSYLLLTMQSMTHMAVVIHNTCRSRTSPAHFHADSSTKWYEKLLWLLTVVSFDAAIVVTVLYWAFLFTSLTKALALMTHAVTTVYVLADSFVSATPVRFLHFVYGSLYGVLYSLFTLFYYLADGTNDSGNPYVYEIADWAKPGSMLVFVAGLIFVAVPIVHTFLFGLYTLRVFIAERCGCGRNTDVKEAPPSTNNDQLQPV